MSRKGAAEALSAVVMTGVLIGVVAAISGWGLPLVQKNKDISMLRDSETFMRDLAGTIKETINSAGSKSLTIYVPAELNFDGTAFRLRVLTEGTIYSTEGTIPLGKNECAPDNGIWGVQEYDTLCTTSTKLGGKFETVYTLKFIQLDTEGTSISSRKVVFSGEPNVGGEKRVIRIENLGAKTENVGAREIVKSDLAVSIGV